MSSHRISRITLRVVGLTLTAVLLSACAAKGPLVRSDFNKSVDFGAYRTFGFPPATGTDRGGYATLVTTYFKDAVRREMSVRGYEYSETKPDLLVNFYSEARDKTEVTSRPGALTGFGYYGYGRPRFGYPRYGWYSNWPFYDSDIDVVNYKAGTFKLDVIDAQKEQTIWEARVEERLTEASQESPQPNIARLVTEMFRKYPRGAAGSPTTAP